MVEGIRKGKKVKPERDKNVQSRVLQELSTEVTLDDGET
jgi:hypothetical protein